MKVEGHRSQLEAGVQAAPARQHLDRCVNRAVATPIGEAAGDADGGEIAEYVAEYCKLAGGGIGYWAAGLQAWVGEGGRGGWARWQGLRPQAHGMTAMQVSAMQVSASSVNFN